MEEHQPPIAPQRPHGLYLAHRNLTSSITHRHHHLERHGYDDENHACPPRPKNTKSTGRNTILGTGKRM